MNPRNFRSLLSFTSWPLSWINPKIRLKLARAIRNEAIRTILDPNSINSRYRNRFGEVNKKVEFYGNSTLLVNINEMIGYRSALNRAWDKTTFQVAKVLDFENLYYVDVGANIGATLIPIAKHGSRCVAVEPNLDVAWRLIFNLNNNSYSKVEVILTALGEDTTSGNWLPMHLDPGNSGAVSLITSDRSKTTGKLVMINSLDSALSRDFLDSLRSSKGKLLIKIDVEGYEARVILGAQRIIREFSPVIILEQNPGADFQSAIDQIRKLGYDLFTITEKMKLGSIDPFIRYENIIAIPNWAKDNFSVFYPE